MSDENVTEAPVEETVVAEETPAEQPIEQPIQEGEQNDAQVDEQTEQHPVDTAPTEETVPVDVPVEPPVGETVDAGGSGESVEAPVEPPPVDAPLPETPVDTGADDLPVQPEEAPVDLGITANIPAPTEHVNAVKAAVEATGCKVVLDPEYPSFLTIMREKEDMTLSYAVNVHEGMTNEDVLKEIAEAGL